MPNVDPPWDKPQDTQYCPNCEELARKLAAVEQRLVVAVELLKELPSEILVTEFKKNNTPYVRCIMCNAIGKISEERHTKDCLGIRTQAFLSNAPGSEWVVVKREDLEKEVSLIEGLKTYRSEFIGFDADYHNRLRSALEPEKGGCDGDN